MIGFCFGVKRAVELAEKHPERLNTLGPLIHNPQEVERLAEQGKVPVDDLKKVTESTVLIRAHGVPDFILKRAKELGLHVINATCPFVSKAHALSKQLEKTGHQVIIIGEPNHAEVMGIVGNLTSPIVVKTLDEAKKLGQFNKLGAIAQTTSNTQLVDQIVEELKKHTQEFKAMETICQATEEHQAAVRELAPKVDVMVVVGGKSSGNTTRLHQICLEYGPAYHIETADEINPAWFTNINTVGLTAGASTPDWIINEVEGEIKNI